MNSHNDGWRLEHSYARLPDIFYERCAPVPVREPRQVIFNRPLAESLGLAVAALEREESAGIFSGNLLPPGADPLAQAYAGHQYGHFTKLGDGRAILLGEQITPAGERFDIQLKGSGRTPFSRGGDGRAALGPMLREYIISEAMQALGIPSTRSLAVATSGEQVQREQPQPGAVLTRVAKSHIRVGTFQWAAAQRDPAVLQALADHTLGRHYPQIAGTQIKDAQTKGAQPPYLALLEAVIEAQAALVAKWLHVGFIHGVMNTDNMALSGETIDYGPCAFMDAYDPTTVFSSIDHHGRYAYGNQPPIAQWNLSRLAQALLPLLHPDEEQAVQLANTAIHGFEATFKRHWLAGMRSKLGLFSEQVGDLDLVQSLLDWMQQRRADFTNTFAALATGTLDADIPLEDLEFHAWFARFRERLNRQPQSLAAAIELMRANNPAVIPRNHKVEEALQAASEHGDLQVMQRLLAALANPYDHTREPSEYSKPAPPSDVVYRTFCGT